MNNSMAKSLEYVSSLEAFQSTSALNSFINKHKDQLTKDEGRTLISFFKELSTYKVRKELNSISPLLLDDTLTILKRFDISFYSKQEEKETEKIEKKEPEEEPLEEQSIKKSDENNQPVKFTSLVFQGTAIEYFKIWIVNVFLTLITLGIYSAWAKVRSNRYFYANTYLHDSSFEYTADPKKILKGRLIVFFIYALFIYFSKVMINPFISLAILGFALLITPWIITKAIKFKLKNTKYKNVNFKYHENSFVMYKFFFIHLLLNLITVGLAYPYSLNKFKELIINNSSYGKTFFNYDGKTKDFYINFIKIILVYVLSIGAVGVFIAFFASSFKDDLNSLNNLNHNKNIIPILTVFVINFFYIFILFGLKAFYDAIMQNYVYGHTKLDNYPLKSTLGALKLTGIYITNILAIIFSLGLLYPWTKIRTLKYKLENTHIAIDDEFVSEAAQVEQESALGEETEDFFDMDIGL